MFLYRKLSAILPALMVLPLCLTARAQNGTDLYFAHVAVGGGYATSFTLTNTGSEAAAGTLSLTTKDGQPFAVTMLVQSPAVPAAPGADRMESTASDFAVEVPAGGSKVLTAVPANPGDPVRTGWAHFSAAGGAVSGVATFQVGEGNILRSIAGVLSSGPVEVAVIPINNDDSLGRYTGYAVANLSAESLNFQMVLRDDRGTPVDFPGIPALVNLGAYKQVSRFLHEDSSAQATFKGTLTLLAERKGHKFAVTALVQDRRMLTAIPVLSPALDWVMIPGGGEVGILVDGIRDAVALNDVTFIGRPGAPLVIGNFTGSSGEMIAFARDRPPTLVPEISWSDGADPIALSLENKYMVPFYIWIVRGPFETQRAVAVDASVTTAQIWSDEGQGVGFSSFEIANATSDPDAAGFHDFSCGMANAMKAQIGFHSGGVNIYYVDTVDFGSGPATTNGVWCGGDLIALGRNASDHLFAHEVGHAFALGHTNSLPELFDVTNVMHNASNSRRYLTEGQTFRAVTGSSSVINNLYDLRPGLQTRSCGTSTVATAPCPAVQKRIWADGFRWPPND